MFCERSPRVAGLGVILCRLRPVTPLAKRLHVLDLVLAAVLQGYDVIGVPSVGRPELPLAAGTVPVRAREDAGVIHAG